MDTTTDVLRAAALDVTRTFDLTSVLDKLLEHLAQLVPYDTASVMLLDDDGRLAVRAIRGYERGGDPALTRDHAFDVPNPVFAALVGHRRSILIADTREYPGWPGHAGTEHVRSWMGVALLAAEVIVPKGGMKGVRALEIHDVRNVFDAVRHVAGSRSVAVHGDRDSRQIIFQIENLRRGLLEMLGCRRR